MFELKAAGSLLVFVFTGMMGMAVRNDMRQRILLLQDLHKGILLIHQEIDYLKAPLEEAIQHEGASLREPLSSFFRAMGKRLEALPGASFSVIWEEEMERHLKGSLLKRADMDLIRQLGKQLEDLELGGRNGMLTVFEQRLEALLQEAGEEYKSKAQLYCRLGLMGGIFLVILFV